MIYEIENDLRTGPGGGRRAARLAPAERRAQLLEVALRIFARRGIGSARHAEIAAEARVSVSTVFVYFPTRPALVEAVLEEVAGFYLALARRVYGAGRPAPLALLDHAEAFAASVDSHPDHARIWLDWSTAIREEIWPRYLEFEAQVIQIIAGNLRRGQREGSFDRDVEPEHGGRLAIGAGHMIAQMKFTGSPPDQVDAFLRTVVRAVGGGLAPS